MYIIQILNQLLLKQVCMNIIQRGATELCVFYSPIIHNDHLAYELRGDRNISITVGMIFCYQACLLHVAQIVPNFKETQLQKFTLGNELYKWITLKLIYFYIQ
jgi:hypothetical protein